MFHARVRRGLAGLAAAGLVLTGLGLTGPADAAEIGSMVLSPATGDQDSLLDVDTLAKCPAESTTFRIDLVGPGIQTDGGTMTSTSSLSLATDNGMGGYHAAVGEPFKDTFMRNNLKDPSGAYTLSFLCTDVSGFEVQGEMNTTVTFTPTDGDYNVTYVAESASQDTATALEVAPADLLDGREDATLTATVTPGNAAGTVQFRSGSTEVGAPVLVNAGTATYTGNLPAGNAGLTAAFVPSNPNAFSPSTSSVVPYVVVGAPTVSGTATVASTVSCATSAGGVQTFAWLKNGTATGVTTKSVKVPNTWYNAAIACTVTVAQGSGTVARTSGTRKVALGPALKNTQAPVASGTAKVGSRLTCKPGTWSPSASSYAWKWLRDGKAILNQTKQTYLLVKADKGHKVQCRVTAKKFGYANGVAKSAARLIG